MQINSEPLIYERIQFQVPTVYFCFSIPKHTFSGVCKNEILFPDLKGDCTLHFVNGMLAPIIPTSLAREPIISQLQRTHIMENELKVIFLPFFLAPGHLIPMVDTARLFAMHGVNVTIITSPASALLFQKAIHRDANSGHQIKTHVLQFPSDQVGLPRGIENFNTVTSLDMTSKLFHGLSLLQPQIEQLFQDMQPDCIVSDMFYPWTVDSAAKLGIPRLLLYVTCYFSLCAQNCVQQYKPHESVNSDTDLFLLPGLPNKIEMTRLQLPEWLRTPNGYTQLMDKIKESERRSYGSILANSFYELEGAYEELHKNNMGIRTWSVGPVSLWVNKDVADKVERGNKAAVEEHELLNWLNAKECNSVLYICFGSSSKFPTAQLIEMAHGLEASGHQFIWVVRQKDGDQGEGWLGDFEKRMKESNRGLIIRGWAAQILILEHPAIGGQVTHCGSNSLLEGVTAGLPMIAWPLYAEQFYLEKLVTEVLKIGVAVGKKEWSIWAEETKEIVKRDDIEKAVKFLMGSGEEAAEMRNRAKELGNAARKAVESSGSSQSNFMGLINGLKSLKCARN